MKSSRMENVEHISLLLKRLINRKCVDFSLNSKVKGFLAQWCIEFIGYWQSVFEMTN